MGRYVCRKNKIVTIKKANDYCILQRCPELAVRRPVIKNRRLEYVIVPVVLETLAEVNVSCQ